MRSPMMAAAALLAPTVPSERAQAEEDGLQAKRGCWFRGVFRRADAVSRNGEKHRVIKQRELSQSAQIVFGFQNCLDFKIGFRRDGSRTEF